MVCLALASCVGLVASGCVTVASDGPGRRVAAAELEGGPGAAASAAASASTTVESSTRVTTSATPDESTAANPSPLAASASVPPLAEPERAIGYISLDESQAFVQAISSGIRAAAAEARLPLIECDAGWTRTGVRACATRLAAAGVEGLISFQPFVDLAGEVCDTLGGVPVVGVIYDQGPCQVARLHVDQAESGRLAGEALGALAARRWDCDVGAFISLESGADDDIGAARMRGFREGYREHCRLPKQRRALADAQHYITAQTKLGAVLNVVRGKPIIIAAVSDDAALGAMNAARQRGRGDHVWAAGQLAQSDVRGVIACDPHFVASVAHFPGRFGAALVPALLDALEGREVSPVLEAELQLVTAATVREVFPDTPDCDA